MTKVVKREKPFHSYYSVLAKKCKCSHSYVDKVLNNKLGKYEKRETDLTRKIKETHDKLYSILSSED